jgi:hypothetical protein
MDVLATPTDDGRVHVAATQEPQTLSSHFTIDELEGVVRHLADALKEAKGIFKKNQAAVEEPAAEEAPAEKPAEEKPAEEASA